MTSGQNAGAIIGSCLIGNGSQYGTFSWDTIRPSSASPIQPIFNHSAGSQTPFQDVNYLASGTGTLTAGGTWTDPDFPKLFTINITGSGAVGVATYQLKVRKTLGFDGVSNSWYMPGVATLPWLCHTAAGSTVLTNGQSPHNLVPIKLRSLLMIILV
jgi:hypothetical protein